MEFTIIKDEKKYEQYLNWVDEMLDKNVNSNTPEGEKLRIALLLIKQYEDLHYTIPVPNSIS